MANPRKEFGTNRTAEEQGAWHSFRGESRYQIRSKNSKPARASQDRINERNRKYFNTGGLPPASVQERNEVDLCCALVADWQNVTDDNDQAMACTEETKRALFAELWELRALILGIASQAESFRDAEATVEEKN